jgi:3',5'-cyclic AMP phosphodiesterase CpdA
LPLRIGVFGDSGFGEEITAALADRLADLQPDLILHTGDLVYLAYQQSDAREAYQVKWYQTLSNLLNSSVIYPVVGNHEMDSDAEYQGLPYYFHAFPMLVALQGGWQDAPPGSERQWYALELGTLQILFLNSQQLYGGPARAEQDAWLASRLNEERFKDTIVVFHVPPYTSGRHQLDGKVVVSSWVPLFEASNVRLVLSGHDHNYERLSRNGITYIVSGGGSTVLYPMGLPQAHSITFAQQIHFVLLDIDSDGIKVQAIGVDGETFDETYVTLSE